MTALRSRRFRRSAAWLATLLIPVLGLAQTSQDRPRKTGIVEETTAQLVQIEFSVHGPPETVRDLGPDDFELKIGLKKIRSFYLDEECPLFEGAEAAPSPATPPRPAPQAEPTTLLLYFDQAHLTLAGRARALDMARSIAPRLLVGTGGRAVVVSSGDRLEVVVDATSDTAALDEGLRRLDADRRHWDLYAQRETERLEQIRQALARGDFSYATNLARGWYREELWRAERELRRLRIALTLLSAQPGRKLALVFTDTLRANAGDHYLALFGAVAQRELLERAGADAGDPREALRVGSGTLGARSVMDLAVAEAAAHGIRLYVVEAQGMATEALPGIPSSRRVGDAQDTMKALALETGGRAFLNGVRDAKIVEGILQDLACVFRISFDPEGLRQDTPLPIRLRATRRGVRIQAPGTLVIQSGPARRTQKLLAAFVRPEAVASEVPTQVQLIPLGVRGGRLLAMLQVAVPYSPRGAGAWDLGATVILPRRTVDFASHLQVSSSDVPVAVQRTLELSEGPVEVVAVGTESVSSVLTAAQAVFQWERPGGRGVTVGPSAVLQTRTAAILRDDALRTRGALACGGTLPVSASAPVVIQSLVCHELPRRSELTVRRSLEGLEAVPFTELRLETGEPRCDVVRDQVPAGSLGPGLYRYRLEAEPSGAAGAEVSVEFHVAPPVVEDGAGGAGQP